MKRENILILVLLSVIVLLIVCISFMNVSFDNSQTLSYITMVLSLQH
jgi:hypothetical protein